jgi:DNA-binding MarR family transcriptional regulator
MTVVSKPRLTESEKRCLKAFRSARKRLGNVPDLGEIAVEAGISKQYASRLMNRLVRKGRIVREGRYRGFKVAVA